MAEKKFFVDINLQGNKLVNPVVGSNSSMTTAGSFQYNAGRLEYYNGSTVEEVANLNDIAAVTGGLILQGGYDAATNTPDIAADASVLKGFFWVVTAAGSFLGEAVQVGDSIIAKQDNPGATAANWLILQGNVVIATDSVDGISRLATQAEADAGTEGGAVVITPATLQGKIDAQVTPEINNKLPLAGGTMSGNLNMGNNSIDNASTISTHDNGNGSVFINGSDVSTVTLGVDRLGARSGSSIQLEFTTLDANGNAIQNLPAPTDGGDAANKTYVDDNTNNKLPLAGGTMSGAIDMDSNNLENANAVRTDEVSNRAGDVGLIWDNDNANFFGIGQVKGLTSAPTAGTDAANKAYVDNQDALKVSKSGDNMLGNLDMDGNSVTNLSTPTNGGDATNKTYVDNAASTAESNANDYTDTEIAAQSYAKILSPSDFVFDSGLNAYKAIVNHGLMTYNLITQVTLDTIPVEMITESPELGVTWVESNIIPNDPVRILIIKTTAVA